jgi:hypothetical protein
MLKTLNELKYKHEQTLKDNTCGVKLKKYTIIHNFQFIRSISCISSYMFRAHIESHLQASLQSSLYVQLLVL